MSKHFRWCEEKTARLINLHEAGLDRSEISRAIGVAECRVKSRLIYLGLTSSRVVGRNDIDLGQKMHELARLRFAIDEAAYVMGIDLPKAFQIAEWYCVKFDEIPVDMATVKFWLSKNRGCAEIAKMFGCSHQKIAAISKAMKARKVGL